ncbi:TPA: hypothetical protein I8149_001816 [Citrobacter freundii]|nr:hypothetical protein [Citrobacter freundii]HAT2484927.1 hypothetical protein [Citrobacter freundii]HAT2720012.1 hypothetical protein [Citrobacter freundii]HAT2730101.1 hypothetical protein [Citrobacter freundii]HBC0512551.1 hypothetical protein [Citrobacter freundii]
MWTKLSKLIPWKTILVVVAILAALYGLFRLGYSGGHDDARRDGDVALSKLQSDFDAYKTEQTAFENAALRAWAARYQAQVVAGQQAEQRFLEQIASLESQNQQLKGQIKNVTQRWIDEKGKSHPIECVFTRGFVRQYNAALGYDNASVDTGHSDTTAASGTGSGTASGQAEATDTWLRDSGVSQHDVLANIIDNAKQCRVWRSQINNLIDEREGLQK